MSNTNITIKNLSISQLYLDFLIFKYKYMYFSGFFSGFSIAG